MIVLDTSLLSSVLRRRKRGASEDAAAVRLRELIVADQPMLVPGIVYQEILSGVPTEDQFLSLDSDLRGFPLALATREHHSEAARITNVCRSKGVQVGTADAIVAATAILARGALFTLDEDFRRVAQHCSLSLYKL